MFMLNANVESTLEKSNPLPATLSHLIDEYAIFARRVRALAGETVRQQLFYIKRFFTMRNILSPGELFERLSVTYVQQFIFDYADEYGPGSRRTMQISLRSFLKFCRHQEFVSRDLSSAVPTYRAFSLKAVPKTLMTSRLVCFWTALTHALRPDGVIWL